MHSWENPEVLIGRRPGTGRIPVGQQCQGGQQPTTITLTALACWCSAVGYSIIGWSVME
jgi:hypothetical protein